MSRFYTFDQNNSGGSFDHDAGDGIGYCVFIEAETVGEAVERAETIGLYFNGCEDGRDCDCCGDRWGWPWGEGKSSPERYGETWTACGDGEEPTIEWGIPSYIHFADGTFKPARKVSE